jgi:GNAT superfamily N-acetyltransferase
MVLSATSRRRDVAEGIETLALEARSTPSFRQTEMVHPASRPVTYCKATPQHGPAIAAQGRAAFVESFSEEYEPGEIAAYLAMTYGTDIQTAELSDPTVTIFVACHKGEVIGHLKLGPTDRARAGFAAGALEIKRFYIRASWKGEGIARKLLACARDEAKRRGATWLYLSCWRGNGRAISFYQKHGFSIVGRQFFPVGARIDEDHIMRCEVAVLPSCGDVP